MIRRLFSRCAAAVTVAIAVAACSADSPLSPQPDVTGPSFTTLPGASGAVTLCKYAPDQEVTTWADFTIGIDPALGDFPLGTEFTLEAGTTNWDEECSIVWTPPADLAETATVTISEVGMTEGMSTEVIVIFQDGLPMTGIIDTNTIEFEVGPDFGATVYFKNRGEPDEPNGGGAGCTPGFWRQAHHYQYWTHYSPTDAWDDAFRDPGVHSGPGKKGATFLSSTTLGEAVEFEGGGIFALARHAVAALLNAASADVDYDMTVGEVISLVNGAIDADTDAALESAKNILEGFNEQGCTVDKSN